MSFEARLKAHYALAKSTDIAQQTAIQVKAQKLAEIVGAKMPPLTHAGLQDGFDRAVRNGLPIDEANRLGQLIRRRGFIETVNDKERLQSLLTSAIEDLKEARKEIASGAVEKEIIKLVPRELREKLTEEQLAAVVREVRDYALALLDFMGAALITAAGQPDTGAGRTVAMAQIHGVFDGYFELQAASVAPLKNFDPNG